MKRRSILWAGAMAVALLGSGCADPLEQTSPQEVKGQFQRGISGEGHLIQNESTNNPTGLPAGSETPPAYPPP
jgi:hypothetical protein